MVKLSKYIIALLVLLTSGCGHFAATRGFPVPSVDVETRLAQMEVYRGETLIEQYNDAVNANNPIERRRIRNDLINGRIALIDIHFNEFLQSLHEEGVGLNVFSDAIAIGLGAAGALASGGTSQILSGATAAVIGTKESVDKNAFFDQTMPALMTKMIAQRKSVLVGIRDGLLNKTDADYPLAQGLADLEGYYYAGTIPGAITGVVQSAGDEATKADAQLRLVFNRPKEFVSKFVQDRAKAIAATLEDPAQVPDSTVLALANGPPASGDKFTAILDKFRAGEPSFTNAAVARFALKVAVMKMDRSEDNLSAWEQRLRLTQPKS